MSDKKKGFLSYGKEDEDETDEAKPPRKDDDEGDGGAYEKRLMHLAEQTGVGNPKALIKLIRACKE
jgi:hypothetical protein